MSEKKLQNPTKESKESRSNLILRGGNAYGHHYYAKPAHRDYDPPFLRFEIYGFRIARTKK